MASIITEGHVSANILSFGEKDFLFTGTVCRAWRQNSVETYTGAGAAVESTSRLQEAVEYGVNPHLASFHSLDDGASIAVIRKLNESYCFWDQFDIERAAQHGRVDVLMFMREKGYPADERVLHSAVRYNQQEVVKYLLGVGCPIDKTVIEWGFGPYIVDELKMRSMEVAISEGNLTMVKILRTVDYPFIDNSFVFACDTQNTEILEYLIQEKCHVPQGLFRESVELRSFFTLAFLIDHKLLVDEWDLWGCIMDDGDDMMVFLLEKGIIPTDDDVDSAIAAGKLGTAKFLTKEYSCRPTPLAYMIVFDNIMCDCHYVMYLDWLHDDMHCSIGFSSPEDMYEDPQGAFVLDNCSSTIEDWFVERIG
ncbi:EsV-1-114 [Ectocarpus siliculosus]|uniref:EsV-1-114 n=1 Tax=Ectocarpus siliculosus TaxID=2880 RepID=D8LPE2_ECTSI|nr:EsV-1-114 [Ectocarpus siliculosus]|eukprot:CBN80414.1 EsV-1-114 [Ectocarpus siliculosus]